MFKLVLSTAIAACAAGPLMASSVKCPAEHVLSEPRELPKVSNKGVFAKVLETVDLAGWREVNNLRLRTRLLTIEPDAVVATHSHADRPSIVYVMSGEILEHSAYCDVPIAYKAGDHAAEAGEGATHWWENVSGEPVIILSSDVVPF